MESVLKSARMTEKQFLALPESVEHIELIDGEVIVAPSATFEHQDVVMELVIRLKRWADSHRPAYVGLSPLDVRIAPGRILQPDLFLLLRGLTRRSMPIAQVPDVAVEVVSQNRTYDRVTKKLIYAEAGVGEYWLVEPATRRIDIYAGLKLVASSKARVSSRVAKGFTVDVKKLFAR